jgi:hypothetical protein
VTALDARDHKLANYSGTGALFGFGKLVNYFHDFGRQSYCDVCGSSCSRSPFCWMVTGFEGALNGPPGAKPVLDALRAQS